MNQKLQQLLECIQQSAKFSDDEKKSLLKTIKEVDKEIEITTFKLDRAEKVKRTTAILLEETIEELEQKRKAVEAQNKELEIESSLERVRTMAMSMSKPNDLMDICRVVYAELQLLGFNELRNAMINIYEDDKTYFLNYDFAPGPGKTITRMPYNLHPLIDKQVRETKNAGDAFNEFSFAGKELKDFRELRKNNGQVDDPKLEDSSSLHYYFYSISTGSLGISTYSPLTKNKLDLLKRFRNVFNLSYQRYIDITKAAAQAREAEIELALERIRARTMAMQRSEELQDAAQLLFQLVQELGTHQWACGYNIWEDDKKACTAWMSAEGTIQLPFKTPSSEDLFLHFYEAAQRGDSLYVEELSVEKCAAHYRYLSTLPVASDVIKEWEAAGIAHPTFQIFNIALFKQGYLMFITYESVPQLWDIFKRFAKVFEQTYTRFLDLQKAETQAKEAQIETALEKVRSRTLAMQKSNELAETAAVLFQQLNTLGIEPNRLSIAIVKDENGASDFWITDEDGAKISTAFSANLNDNLSFAKMFDGWKQQKKSLILDMQGEELQNYFSHLTTLGVPFKDALSQKRRVQDIAYFCKGFIGIASPDEQPQQTLQLLERFAAVFNLTFTRFNDLQIAEAHALQAEEDLIAIKEAKQKAEETLTELQAMQKQLIQSEKMASLGELTAGIAHEIQNPLNFVNNFSEVNTELLDELKSERSKLKSERDENLENELLNDISENEKKINQHGKRAEAIVKGMLQHSRSSSNTKEPTAINRLTDEYLHLAYHGIRAKDNSFNATLKTDYDETIGNINIIPQDIGRVILNLITNAFYVVDEKKKQQPTGYEPTVTVSTSRSSLSGKGSGGEVLIKVKDNGNGIPQKILDKIFQPFFTTKPTGQGTGLGLSLAYDIVKAHGGEVKVETKEGEGSIFSIILLIQNLA